MRISEAKIVLKQNREKIWRIKPVKYPYLCKTLDWRSGAIKDMLCSAYKYLQKPMTNNGKIIVNRNGDTKRRYKLYQHPSFFTNKITFTLPVKQWMGFRGSLNQKQTFKYVKFLVFTGLVGCVPQSMEHVDKLFKFNKKHLLDSYKELGVIVHPYNIYTIQEYTENYLDECELRAKHLFDSGITPNSISLLEIEYKLGLSKDKAREKYYPNNYIDKCTIAEENKRHILTGIETFVKKKGYCTKLELLKSIGIREYTFKSIFNLFQDEILSKYNYKRPNKEEKQRLGLDKGYMKKIFFKKKGGKG